MATNSPSTTPSRTWTLRLRSSPTVVSQAWRSRPGAGIEQHADHGEVGGCAGNVGTPPAHRNPDLRRPQRGCVVHPIADHRHLPAFPLELGHFPLSDLHAADEAFVVAAIRDATGAGVHELPITREEMLRAGFLTSPIDAKAVLDEIVAASKASPEVKARMGKLLLPK